MAILVIKGKTLLALFKLKFLLSLGAFVAFYWALYGVKFGVGFAILMRFVLKGNPQAGLPLLNGGTIAGYLLSFALVYGTSHWFGLI